MRYDTVPPLSQFVDHARSLHHAEVGSVSVLSIDTSPRTVYPLQKEVLFALDVTHGQSHRPVIEWMTAPVAAYSPLVWLCVEFPTRAVNNDFEMPHFWLSEVLQWSDGGGWWWVCFMCDQTFCMN